VQNVGRQTARERRAPVMMGEQISASPGSRLSTMTGTLSQEVTGGGGDQKHFTGVVLIHGLGLIPRNSMLQQALNALSYWFNHEADLGLSTKGSGRLWIVPHLTDDPDPDQPASRATVDLVARGNKNVPPSQDAAVRLEFREVWWAESFGMPDIGQTLTWARVQWREQAAHLLIPVRWRRRLATASNQTRAREKTGKDTGLPEESLVKQAMQTSGAFKESASTDRRRLGTWSLRTLRSLLWLYDLYQYLWKLVQWLILTPVITLLLIIMSIVRVLAIIPFLQSAVIATFTAVINSVMLHWVAEIQVYLTDYTRSSAIRERFSSEVEELLRNPHCDRVVVIAESAGTYIAYEGLTTLLAQSDLPPNDKGEPKPVTFVSIATALRRIWLLSNTDFHRLHGVLPRYVRWLHFWARYDPVAVGPLTESSLPPIPSWDPPEENPYQQIRDTLKDCINFAVVNTDSTFTDHVHYWDNIEQVVGPIANELVAGHLILEQEMRARLVSPQEVLQRRWGIAWRYVVAFAGGLAGGLAVLLWAVSHPGFGSGITAFLGQVDWGGIVNSVCAPCQAFVGTSVPSLSQNPSVQQLDQYSQAAAITYLFTHYLTVPTLVIVALALIVMGLTDALIAQLVAKPAPFAFPESVPTGSQRLGSIFANSAVGIGLTFVASLIFAGYVHQLVSYAAVPTSQLVSAYVLTLGLDEVVYGATYVLVLVAIVQQRQWGWGAGLLFSLFILTTFNPFYRTALLAVAVVGCILLLFRPERPSGAFSKVILVLVVIMAVDTGIGTTLFQFDVVRTPLLGGGVYLEYVLPALIYALWTGRTKPDSGKSRTSTLNRTCLALALVYLGLVDILAVPFSVTKILNAHLYSIAPSLDMLGSGSASSPDVLRAVGVTLTFLVGVVMLLLCVVDAGSQKRWGWLIAIPVMFVGLTGGLDALSQSGVKSTLPEGGLLLSFSLVATALIYVLWAGPARWRAQR
jgi:hypothetical protein